MKSLLISALIVGGVFVGAVDAEEQYWVANDLTKIVTSPGESLFKYHSPWAWVGVTSLLFIVDQPVTHFYLKDIEPRVKQAQIEKVINDRNLFNFVYLLRQLNIDLQDDQLTQLSYLGGQALINSHFVAQSLKHVFGRARPVLTDSGPHDWGHLETDLFGPYTAFPSSHATWYFSFFTIAGKVYGNELGADLLGAAAYFSIVNHNHWSSDMWMGYLLGKAIGNYVWETGRNKPLAEQWFVFPVAMPGHLTGIACQKVL